MQKNGKTVGLFKKYEQGVRGGNFSKLKEFGNIILTLENGRCIEFDNFIDTGDSYKRRESTLIHIRDGYGDVIFEGTMFELINKLSDKRNK